MLIYLSLKSGTDIQFLVYNWAVFTHNTRRGHDEAVNSICRYLVETQGQGLTFDPNSDMKMDCYMNADFVVL